MDLDKGPRAGAASKSGAGLEEKELIRRAYQGDAGAWEALVRQHQEPVFRFAYLQLGDADEAEDTTQDAFIRAYQAIRRFDQERPLRPWLLSIAAHLASNRRRSIGRYLAALQRFKAVESPPATLSMVEEKSAQRQESQVLWQAIRRLKPYEQQVIYLRFFLELSIEEVAQALGTPQGTIKSRLHRALSRLREVIERDFPGLKGSFMTEAGDQNKTDREGQGSNGSSIL